MGKIAKAINVSEAVFAVAVVFAVVELIVCVEITGERFVSPTIQR